jgi:hypothetical protein
VARDWHAWYDDYDDPGSSLSRRLAVVREQLTRVLAEAEGPVRLLSLCSGDGRDTVPVLAALPDREAAVAAVLVELDSGLAAAARAAAGAAGLMVDVRTGDAGLAATWRDVLPADVLMLCGVFGNVPDADIRRTVAAVPVLLREGGRVIWTRGNRVPQDPTEVDGDPSEWVRGLFAEAGLVEEAFVQPADAGYRVGVHRRPAGLHEAAGLALPDRLFAFV